MAPGVDALLTRYKSNNASYGQSETAVIEISSGGNTFLHGLESYLSFEFTPTFTPGTSGTSPVVNEPVFLEGTAFSLLQRVTLYHGSNELFSINHAGKLWNMLRDFQCSVASAGTVNLGVAGSADGIQLTSGSKYSFAIPLIAPLIGSLSEKATPIGWAGASGNLRLEIQFVTAAQAYTNTVSSPTLDDLQCASTASGPSNMSFVIKNLQYNAKISRLSGDLNRMLIEQFGERPITIDAVDYRCEQVQVPDTQTAITARLNFQFNSLKAVFWWCLDQTQANGSLSTYRLGRSQSSRFAGGRLKQYWLTVDGADTLRISTDRMGDTMASTGAKEQEMCAAVAWMEMQRIFNGIAGTTQPCFIKSQYAMTDGSYTAQMDCPGRFAAGIDLEKSYESSSVSFAGINTKNSNLALSVEWNPANGIAGRAATGSPATLFAYGLHDVIYSLVNGTFVRSD